MPQTSRPVARTRGALMLAAEAFDHLTARAHEFHRAISDIPFATLGRVPAVNAGSEPVRLVHDGITDGVYQGVRGIARVLFAAADSVLRTVESARRVPVGMLAAPVTTPLAIRSQTPRSHVQDDLVGVLSGMVGDHMARRYNPLAIRFGAYLDGRRIRAETSSLRAAFPDAQPRIAVFLHGLCGNENTWSMFQQPGDPQTVPYSERLAQDLGYTPVVLRYNSGLHISLNGRSCARLLDRLQAQWPVPLQEIVLIGHSMGGLVARSAADVGATRGAAWIASLRQVVCLGSPHLGAPLEKVVHVGTHLMKRIPLSRPIAKLLDSRSLGIKDLRWGYTQDLEWKRRDPDEFWTADRTQTAPVPGVRYRFLGTCLTGDPLHPLTRAIGDGLVRLPSSLAADIAGADTAFRARVDHLRLLNHPEVYAQLREWLAPASERTFPA